MEKAEDNLTITDKLNQIANEMCNHYCKWPDLWDEEAEGMELCDSEHCQNCPLNGI